MRTRPLITAAASLAILGGGMTATATAAPAPDPQGVTLQVDRAGFVTPTGNLACVIDDSGVTCGAEEHDWATLPVSCETGEGGSFMRLEELAGPSCIGDPLRLRAEVPGPLTGYYDRAGEARHDVTYPETEPERTFAGLNYGTTVQNDTFRVQVEQTGVTATNLKTGHSFTMSREQVSAR